MQAEQQEEVKFDDFTRDPSAIKIIERIQKLTQKVHALVDECKACKQETKRQ